LEVQAVPVDTIRVSDRIRADLGDLTDLQQSMATRGLINPVTVTADRRLIAGERRLESAKRLGWTSIDAQVWKPADGMDLLDVEAEENLCRKQLTEGEAELYRQRRMRMQQDAARERQGTRTDLPSGNLPEGRGNAADKASERTGYTRRTLDKVQDVRETACDENEADEVREEAQRQHDALMAGTQNATAAQAAVRRRRRQVKLNAPLMPGARLESFEPTMPDKTLTRRLLDAIKTGRGLAAMAVEIEGCNLDLDNQTIKSLQAHLRAENKERSQLIGALGRVLDTKKG